MNNSKISNNFATAGREQSQQRVSKLMSPGDQILQLHDSVDRTKDNFEESIETPLPQKRGTPGLIVQNKVVLLQNQNLQKMIAAFSGN